jgi:hypothetical protein
LNVTWDGGLFNRNGRIATFTTQQSGRAPVYNG